MLLIYLGTFMGLTTLLLIPLILLAVGLSFQMYISKKIVHDEGMEPAEARDIFIYTVIALAVIGMGSLVSRDLFKPPLPMAVELSITDQYMYGIMYAICEERFFRGAVTSFFMWKINSIALASFASGGAFMIYHFKVYGSAPDKLLYVAIAGSILAFVTLRSHRLSPATLAHIGNNVMAVSPISRVAMVLGGFFL